MKTKRVADYVIVFQDGLWRTIAPNGEVRPSNTLQAAIDGAKQQAALELVNVTWFDREGRWQGTANYRPVRRRLAWPFGRRKS